MSKAIIAPDPPPEPDKAEQIRRMEKTGSIVRGCLACREFYDAPNPLDVFAPRHTASQRCESGKRPHCTCDTCF
jgi:hypothetical protein